MPSTVARSASGEFQQQPPSEVPASTTSESESSKAAGSTQDEPSSSPAPEASEAPRDPQTAAEGVWPWREQKLTGDWSAARAALEDRGIDFEASMVFDVVCNFSGGIRTGTDYPHLFNLQLDLDLSKLIGLEGGEIFALGQFEQGQDPSINLVGDYQGVDDIAIQSGIAQLSQLWYRQSFLESRVSVQIGLLDYYFSFASPTAGALFINNGPNYPAITNVSVPTYPDQRFGALVDLQPVPWAQVLLAVYDGTIPPALGAPNGEGSRGPGSFFDNTSGYFVAGEVDFEWTLSGGRAGMLGLGGWGHTGEFATFSGGVQDGLTGFYGYLQQTVWMADEKDPNGPALTLFLIGGTSEQSVNPAAWSLAGGVEWQGPIDGRPQDTAGFGFGLVRFSDEATVVREPYECALEAFYLLQLTPWLAIQPDLQFVIDPGGGAVASSDAFVGILRVTVNF